MGNGAGIVLVDYLLRRLLVPLVLIASTVFRYNVLSLVYLLLFFASLVLPGPHLKTQKAFTFIYLSVLLVWSGLAVVGQVLFQIVLLTDYSDQLQPCEQQENIWRQFGFILYRGAGISAVDVMRHLLPDCVVFICALTNLITNARIVYGMRKGRRNSESVTEETQRGDAQEEYQDNSGDGRNSELPEMTSSSSTNLCFPSNVQCYWRLPKITLILFDVCIFITLGLAGVAVPSLTSLAYYLVFLTVLVIWSFHQTVRLRVLVRVLRCILTFYTMVHLIVLYLYQFQAAQQNIPLLPDDTAKSLLARLFGLTAVVRTDCDYPTHLLLYSKLPFPVFVNPALLLILCWLLTTELRLWINTPGSVWKEHEVYHLPVRDSPPSSFVVCLVSSSGSSSPVRWTQYGTYRIGRDAGQASAVDGETRDDRGDVGYIEYQEREGEDIDELDAMTQRRRKVTWQDLKKRVMYGMTTMWTYFLSTSYIPAIIIMMLWSVLYPSWPALVLLLWACTIWLIPKFTPKNSLFYTSPLLALYSLCLLLLQYVFSLDLTLDELSPVDGLGEECYNSSTPGCKSIVPFLKTAFTVVFFCAFHEFVRIIQENKHRQSQSGENTDGDERAPTTVVQRLGSELVKSTYALLSSYWVLVVVVAFLLVFLSGEPSLLKTIYLIFFFVFLITYQLFRNWWYYICVPMWWGLVVYAALELVLVYTYQFDSISDAWERAYDNTPGLTVESDKLFHSIGLRKYGINSLRSLLISLIPPTIFIAVMALQLRYFSPKMSGTASDNLPLDLNTSAVHSSSSPAARSSAMMVNVPLGNLEEEETEAPQVISPASTVVPRLYHCYQITSYVLLKTKLIFLYLVQLSWRFLELHLHKISMLVLFAVSLSEVSAGYWILLAVSLLAVPLPYFSPLLYPLITTYIGLLATLKTIYQFPIINTDMFNLTRINETETDETQCYEPLNTSSYFDGYSGSVFEYHYSSRIGDGGWFGLHKVSNYAQYLAGPLSIGLLLSLHFSAKRHQAEFYHSQNITINPWERHSLFLKVSLHEAEKSIIAAFKYLINHIFDFYGVEITLVLFAITVAVRIDIYGVFYCAILGMLLLTPRRIMAFVWLPYTVLHGMLLLLQYSMLLGVPPGACFYPDGNREYPWSNITECDTTNFGLKKWFFLSDYPQILEKSLLYVDFLTYLLLCMQLYNFRSPRELSEPLSNFLSKESFINSVKVFMTKYYFWVSIFLVFFAAVSRVSIFGFFYLLLCFALVYRGQNMLEDRQTTRTRSWTIFRLIAWGILFIRVSTQILDCVFYHELGKEIRCSLILALNGGCNRQEFYGSTNPDCEAFPHNVGLWVDALTFTVITLQIIIFDTQYSEMMRNHLVERSRKAGYFSDVFEEKMEMQQQKAKEMREKEFTELKERAKRLSFDEDTIDHILHAGVRIPPEIILRTGYKVEELGGSREDNTSLVTSDDEEPKSKLAEEHSDAEAEVKKTSKLSQLWKFLSNVFVEFVDQVIDWLEKSSSLYVEIVEELQQQQERNEEQKLKKEETETSVEEPGSVQVQVEVHHEEEQSLATADIGPSVVTPVTGSEQSHSESTHHSPVAERNVSLRKTKMDPLTEDDESVHMNDSVEDNRALEDVEDKLNKVAEEYSKRPVRFLKALQNAMLAHAEFVVYFLVILNVILNGSVLSLGYASLLFVWGLLCIPWPSKTFWLTMIFYSMLVLALKYIFQFYDIDFRDDDFQYETGFSLPKLLGIVYYRNSSDFFANAAWDMFLLIALILNRGLLKQSGLWRQYHRTQAKAFYRVKNEVKIFFTRLLNPDVTQGASDYYVIMLFFDVLCFITIVFGVSSFGVASARGGGGVSQAATSIKNDDVPLQFVILLLLQFLSMLVDRAIYLRHALKAKFAFQMILLVLWHLWLLFLLPSSPITKKPFTENVAAQFIYFFKSLYFIVSSFQIISGYPTKILGYFLSKKYTTIYGLLFSGYRAIPLLPELREVMDWMFTDTALSLFHWLRVQEIYAKLYLVKVRREREKGSPRDLGEQQSLLIKVLLGGLLLVGLVLLIWGPLLLFSFINSTSVANHPVATTISLSLNSYEPLVQITVQGGSLMSLTEMEYQQLKHSFRSEVQPLFDNQFHRSDFTKAVFPNQSTSLWTVSPPGRKTLLMDLEIEHNNSLRFSWSIRREPQSSLATEIVTGFTRRTLVNDTDGETIDAFIANLENDNTDVLLEGLYPRLIYAPGVGVSTNYTDLSRYFKTTSSISCNTSLSSNNTQEWWRLSKCTNPICTNPNPICTNSGQPVLLIYSGRIASKVFSLIASAGIIGLYVSVVLVIGRLIRSAISSLPSQLLLDEIVNPNPLLKLCNDIFTVRESKDFKLEELLVGKLFAILRSPERLIELTENIKEKQD